MLRRSTMYWKWWETDTEHMTIYTYQHACLFEHVVPSLNRAQIYPPVCSSSIMGLSNTRHHGWLSACVSFSEWLPCFFPWLGFSKLRRCWRAASRQVRIAVAFHIVRFRLGSCYNPWRFRCTVYLGTSRLCQSRRSCITGRCDFGWPHRWKRTVSSESLHRNARTRCQDFQRGTGFGCTMERSWREWQRWLQWLLHLYLYRTRMWRCACCRCLNFFDTLSFWSHLLQSRKTPERCRGPDSSTRFSQTC